MGTTSSPAFTTLLSAAALSLAFALPAQADTPRGQLTPAQQVGYADLDLGNAHDASVMLQRLAVAADQACGARVLSPLLPRAAANHRACVTETVAAATAQINEPMLTAVRRRHLQPDNSVSLAAR